LEGAVAPYRPSLATPHSEEEKIRKEKIKTVDACCAFVHTVSILLENHPVALPLRERVGNVPLTFQPPPQKKIKLYVAETREKS